MDHKYNHREDEDDGPSCGWTSGLGVRGSVLRTVDGRVDFEVLKHSIEIRRAVIESARGVARVTQRCEGHAGLSRVMSGIIHIV